MIYRHRAKDLPEMRRFYRKLLKGTRNFVPYSPRLNKETFGDNRRLKYYIFDKGKIVAHMMLYKVSRSTYDIGVAVDIDYRDKGYAKRLLDFAEQVVKQKRGIEIIGSIYKNNWQSVKLFSKQGYKITEQGDKLYAIKKL